MVQADLNLLTRSLREICKNHIVEEKWLIAPTRRVGLQWLDSVSRSGMPVLNVRVKSLQSLALELAADEMVRMGMMFLYGVRGEVLISCVFGRLKEEGDGYLSLLDPNPGLIKIMTGTIRDLRLAGLKAVEIDNRNFEVKSKGREVKTLLAEYEKRLRADGLVDYADVLRIATERLVNDPYILPPGALVLLSGDMEKEFRGLERVLWNAIPREHRKLLEVSRPAEPSEKMNDAALLSWILKPTEAPSPRGDNTAGLFRAVGEVNEVREVLRRCVENKIPFDEVEIVHTDTATYVPLIYETTLVLKDDGTEDIPVTFAEGIPISYSRPARALKGWLSWMGEDYPQSLLVRLIQDGLLRIEVEEEEPNFSQLGAMLRAIPVGFGRERYLEALDEKISALEGKAGKNLLDDDGNGTRSPGRKRDFGQRIEELKAIRSLVKDLLGEAQVEEGSQRKLLEGAATFLEKRTRRVNQIDEYSYGLLMKEIRELKGCLEDVEFEGLDVREWLAELIRSAHVGGKGPRPGCVYVSPIHSGGSSGRKQTFIMGLDDSRFPGVGRQDPLLLDGERFEISGELPTGAGRLARNVRDFAELLARLRGNVTLSYCCRSLKDDREMFPSPVMLSAHRILSGNHGGDQGDLMNSLSDPASFAPRTSDRCIDTNEWWLWRMCGEEGVEDSERAVAENFPHLGWGLEAKKARKSAEFTEYDGYVPQAGKDCDPTVPDGPILSASRLETLGRCPLEYFFRYILEIEPPEEYEIDPGVWLDPAKKGGLLHVVFREFMRRLREMDLLPDYDRNIELLQKILDDEIESWVDERPPPGSDVFEREVRELRQTARIFLLEEQRFCRGSRPVHFEVAIGLPSEGVGTPLDTPDPAKIVLPTGETLRVRGRIDRVDEISGTGENRLTIWDYKTGSSWKYDPNDPFRQGRCVQNFLYLALAESRINQVYPGAAVVEFGYFFPNIREQGERISWTSAQLAEGKKILGKLCEMMVCGCFPLTDEPDDVRYSDYGRAFGDVEAGAESIARKLGNPDNDALGPFRKLRGYENSKEE